MRFLSFNELKPSKGVPYCRVHLMRLVEQKKFPAPVPVGAGRIAWVEAEVDDWLKAKVAQRDGDARAA